MSKPHIALIGLGLIGSSLGHAFKKHGVAGHITGYARSPETRARARELGFVDAVHDSAASAADTTPASAASAVATSRRSDSTGAPPPTPVQLRLSDGADVDASAQGPDQETRERANAQERSSADVVLFQKLIADKKVRELDIARAGGVSKPQMLKVLAMFGGCEHLFPSSARTKARSRRVSTPKAWICALAPVGARAARRRASLEPHRPARLCSQARLADTSYGFDLIF